MSQEPDNKKNDMISSIYFDRAGFGSKKQTLKDAREKDKSITMADIDNFFSQNVEQKKQIRGRNTFVAPEPFYEFQTHLFFINDLKNQKFKAGAIMIDVFSRFMMVVPIKKTDEDNVAAGMIEALNKMGGETTNIIHRRRRSIKYKIHTGIFGKRWHTAPQNESTREPQRTSHQNL